MSRRLGREVSRSNRNRSQRRFSWPAVDCVRFSFVEMSSTQPASPHPAERFPGNTPFSYVCHRCRACCHDKLIQVNPYEIARLARNRGGSTTAFIANFLDRGVYLHRVENGACVFLGPEGCTVHPDRPLVCRLYPLGGHVGPDDTVTYSHVEPHPETKGVYGREGTMADYIARQG